MKRYGMNQATEFTKKQISVIYANAKSGTLNVEKWVISRMYDLAEFYGMDTNGEIAREEQEIKKILDLVFAGNIEEAQKEINWYTETEIKTYTTKWQSKLDRTIVA